MRIFLLLNRCSINHPVFCKSRLGRGYIIVRCSFFILMGFERTVVPSLGVVDNNLSSTSTNESTNER